MASGSTPKRMQSIESGQRKPALFLICICFLLALYRRCCSGVPQIDRYNLRGVGALGAALSVSKTMGGLTWPFVHLVTKS